MLPLEYVERADALHMHLYVLWAAVGLLVVSLIPSLLCRRRRRPSTASTSAGMAEVRLVPAARELHDSAIDRQGPGAIRTNPRSTSRLLDICSHAAMVVALVEVIALAVHGFNTTSGDGGSGSSHSLFLTGTAGGSSPSTHFDSSSAASSNSTSDHNGTTTSMPLWMVWALRGSLLVWAFYTRYLHSIVPQPLLALAVVVPCVAETLRMITALIHPPITQSEQFFLYGDGVLLVCQWGSFLGIVGFRWLLIADVNLLFKSIPPDHDGGDARRCPKTCCLPLKCSCCNGGTDESSSLLGDGDDTDNKDEGERPPPKMSALLALQEDLASVQYEKDIAHHWVSPSLLTAPAAASSRRKSPGVGFTRALFNIWGWRYGLMAIVKLAIILINLIMPLLLKELVEALKHHPKDVRLSSSLIITIVVLNIVTTFMQAHYDLKLRKVAMHIRGVLSSALYRHVLLRRQFQFGRYNTGDVTNFMTVDAFRVADQVPNLNDLWALPLQTAITLYFLYLQVSWAFLTGLGIAVALVPLNMWLAKKIGKVNTEMMKHNDVRVQRLTEAMSNIKYIKLCGLSEEIIRWIQAPRDRYMKYLRWVKLLDAWCVFFWATTPVFVSLATFATYVSLGYTLEAGRAIAALALFNALIAPLNAYPWVLNGAVELNVSRKRLEGFFAEFGISQQAWGEALLTTADGNDASAADSPVNIDLRDSEFTYPEPEDTPDEADKTSPKEDDVPSQHIPKPRERFTLQCPSFNAYPGALVAIVGGPASGKSTLLAGLAGERVLVSRRNGSAPATNDSAATSPLHGTSVAYHPQQPFLLSSTVRENILFGESFNASKYQAALDAAGLLEDIQLQFAEGDSTQVGDNGAALSGGQRHRVALARAFYADRDCYLLDDPFSALDPAVRRHVFERFVLPLCARGKTVILATHQMDVVESIQTVYECKGGRVTQCRDHRPGHSNILQSETSVAERSEEDEKTTIGREKVSIPSPAQDEATGNDDASAAADDGGGGDAAIDREMKKGSQGRIALSVLMGYILRVGAVLSFIVVLFVGLMQAARNGSDFYIAWTVDHDPHNPHFLAILGIIAGSNAVLAIVRSFSFAFAGLRAARLMHDDLLRSILRSSFQFLSSVSPGQLVNRLGKDVYNVDDPLPFMVNIVLAQFFLLIGSVVVIIISASWIVVLVLIPVQIMYWILQRPYRRINREVKRLESAGRTPLIDNLRNFFEGGAVMRSFGLDTIQHFLGSALWDLDRYQRTQYNLISLMAWFALRLQFLAVIVLIVFGAAATYYRLENPLSGAAVICLGMAYVSSLTGYLSGLWGAVTETEKLLISVERIEAFAHLQNEDALLLEQTLKETNTSIVTITGQIDDVGSSRAINRLSTTATRGKKPTTASDVAADVPTHWPLYGAVDFSSVTLRYELVDAKGGHLPHPPPPRHSQTHDEGAEEEESAQHQNDVPAVVPRGVALSEVSFHIEPGDRVAVVGRTGAGKTSLFNAFLRLFPLHSGRITVDGVDVSHVPVEQLRRSVGVLPQDPFLFKGTLRQNVRCDFTSSDDEDDETILDDAAVRECLDQAGLSSLSPELMLEEGGKNLSVGQRQLVSLARLFLRQHSLLLLDEPSASIGEELHKKMFQSLSVYGGGGGGGRRLSSPATVLMITHRLDSLKVKPTPYFNKALLMRGGMVVKLGSPAEIISLYEEEEEQ